jgi:hypothetical protein
LRLPKPNVTSEKRIAVSGIAWTAFEFPDIGRSQNRADGNGYDPN